MMNYGSTLQVPNVNALLRYGYIPVLPRKVLWPPGTTSGKIGQNSRMRYGGPIDNGGHTNNVSVAA